MIIQPEQFRTSTLIDLSRGKDICSVLSAAIQSAYAGKALKQHLYLESNHLYVDNISYNLSQFKRIIVIGAGKAVSPMGHAIQDVLGDRVTKGLIITKDGYVEDLPVNNKSRIEVLEASHPLPSQKNIAATLKLLSLIENLQSDDLVFFLLSGGSSSLLIKPSPGISLEDIQSTTSLLLRSGAEITEINTIRKHLEVLKGGGLAQILFPATVISLILSDVLGDPIDQIGSGPTAPDPTTYRNAWKILGKYELQGQVTDVIRSHFQYGMSGKLQDNLKPDSPVFDKVLNIVIGNNASVVSAAATAAERIGFHTLLLTTSLHGEASQVGISLCEEAKSIIASPSTLSRPACFISGGETTVTVNGSGRGGRNQELALSSVIPLSQIDDFVLISLATDGGDGPTDAAGAVASSETYSRGLAAGLVPGEFLRRNDSYHYFEGLGDLIKTGPTWTNVNDLVLIFAL